MDRPAPSRRRVMQLRLVVEAEDDEGAVHSYRDVLGSRSATDPLFRAMGIVEIALVKGPFGISDGIDSAGVARALTDQTET